MKYIPASITKTAFNCPHCDVLAHQKWHSTFSVRKHSNSTPEIVGDKELENIKLSAAVDKSGRFDLPRSSALARRIPSIFNNARRSLICSELLNVSISECYNCGEISIWAYDCLIYPQRGDAPSANADMPDEVLRDYLEASAILNLSPRGAAALLRLAIQKLCKHLGQSGENINQDIKAMVEDGLDTKVQRALDAVRVIGNNAVHPGQIDLQDNRAIAESLFRLLNLITEKMITEPKLVDEVYASLPETARHAIEKRDGKTKS